VLCHRVSPSWCSIDGLSTRDKNEVSDWLALNGFSHDLAAQQVAKAEVLRWVKIDRVRRPVPCRLVPDRVRFGHRPARRSVPLSTIRHRGKYRAIELLARDEAEANKVTKGPPAGSNRFRAEAPSASVADRVTPTHTARTTEPHA
jgi:hypothetical protein